PYSPPLDVPHTTSYLILVILPSSSLSFFFNDTATTEIYTLSLHDALPISRRRSRSRPRSPSSHRSPSGRCWRTRWTSWWRGRSADRKSTRLNSSHDQISYAVFCLKKKKKKEEQNIDEYCKLRTIYVTTV